MIRERDRLTSTEAPIMNKHAPLPRRHHQRGAVVIVLGVTIVMLIGFAGLAIDLGRFFVIKSELQNAMDACALSAASQLSPKSNNANTIAKVVAYGKFLSTEGIGVPVSPKNKANFQSTPLNPSILEITFSDNNAGPFSSSWTADTSHVMCTYPLANLPIYFMKVLNPFLSTQIVTASAVASKQLPLTSCAPIGLCEKTPAYNRGDWVTISEGPGNPSFIDFTPPASGTDDVAEILTGSKLCDVSQTNFNVEEQGVKAGAFDEWNTRFGLYKGNDPTKSVTEAPPDRTGFAYTVKNPAQLAITDYWTRLSTFSVYQTTPPNPYYSLPGNATAPSLRDSGIERRRIVVTPIVDCAAKVRPVKAWGCVLMLKPIFNTQTGMVDLVEYLGKSTDPSPPSECFGGSPTYLAPVLTQ